MKSLLTLPVAPSSASREDDGFVLPPQVAGYPVAPGSEAGATAVPAVTMIRGPPVKWQDEGRPALCDMITERRGHP